MGVLIIVNLIDLNKLPPFHVGNFFKTGFEMNQLMPKSDEHLISPYNISPESHI